MKALLPVKSRRFIVLLAGLAVVLGLQPLIAERTREGGLAAGLIGLLIPLFAVWVAQDTRRHLIISLFLGTLSLVGNSRHVGLPALGSEALGTATSLLFVGYTTIIVLGAVLRSRRITGDILAGAIAGYLMLGVSWAMVHLLVDQLTVGAYTVPLRDAGGFPDFPQAFYFSFITLLTIGYGDITPVNHWARALTVIEGLSGWVFGTILVATLVANYIAQRDREGPRSE